MMGRRYQWHLAWLTCFLAGVVHAQTHAVVAGDEPVTVTQAMRGDASLAEVVFIDPATGWAVGDRGVIWHTNDGGQSWQLQPSGVSCPLAAVFFFDAKQGLAAGGTTQLYSHASRGVLLSTADGGRTWTELPQSTLPAIRRVKFFDALNGIAAGDANASFPSGVFTTRDGGRTWQPAPSETSGQWIAADFPDPESGTVAGRAGSFAALMRRRVVASPSAVSGSRAFRALRLTPPTGGWLVGDGGLVMTTRDLGSTWQTPAGELPLFAAENFDFGAVAVYGQRVWVAGSPGTRVFHSADGGNTWHWYPTGQTAPIRSIAFVDANRGWAVGDFGSVLATTDGGRNWSVQRAGGRRAALLAVVARETDVPLELLGKFAAEESYLTAVNVLHGATESRGREAALLAGAMASHDAWQFPIAAEDAPLSPAELLALLNRESDGRAMDQLSRYVVRQLRMWRPDVVVTHPPQSPGVSSLQALVGELVTHCVELAADSNQFSDLANDVGLEPWQVTRVFGLLPPESEGDVRIATGQFAPRLGTTLADWSSAPRRLLHSKHTAPPDTVELRRLFDASGQSGASQDPFAGIRLEPGGEARRQLANLASDDIEQLRRVATRRRQMMALVARSQDNPGWAGQVMNLVDGLDAESGGELLFQLAEGYRATGRLDLAADAYSTLARRWPDHELVEPALVWLVQFYCSGEVAQRLADRKATNFRPPAGEVQQESAVAATPVTGLSRDDRLARAIALGKYVESSRPGVYADPSVRIPLVVAERKLGYANPAQRYFLSLRSLPEDSPWRRCGETEEWFARSTEGLPPPKTLGTCRRAAERPHLDGQLDEPLWKAADRLQLRGHSTKSADVRLTHDAEFLYVAIRCPKADGVEYVTDDRPRPRDADLASHDRVAINIDTDRDFTTAFELVVDHRGWTHDACWDDATWNPAWYVAAASGDKSWTIEAAIPLAELVDRPPSARDVWAVSAVRTTPGFDRQSWSGNATAADSPDRFGLLIFE